MGHPEQQRALMAFHAASGPSMSVYTVCRGSSRWSRSCRLAGGPRRHRMASSAAMGVALGLPHRLVDVAPPDQQRRPTKAGTCTCPTWIGGFTFHTSPKFGPALYYNTAMLHAASLAASGPRTRIAFRADASLQVKSILHGKFADKECLLELYCTCAASI